MIILIVLLMNDTSSNEAIKQKNVESDSVVTKVSSSVPLRIRGIMVV